MITTTLRKPRFLWDVMLMFWKPHSENHWSRKERDHRLWIGSVIVFWGEPQLEESRRRVFFSTGPLGGSRMYTRQPGSVQEIMHKWVPAPLDAAFFNHLTRTHTPQQQISHFTPHLRAPGAQGCSRSFYHQPWDGTAAGSTEVPQRTGIALFTLRNAN